MSTTRRMGPHVSARSARSSLSSIASVSQAAPPGDTQAPLLRVDRLRKHFVGQRSGFAPAPAPVRAVDGVSFSLARGETLALVGESGCGKTTTAKSVLRLIEPTSGSVQLDGEELTTLSPDEMRARRRDLQIVFQDPYASLSPRLSAGQIVGEPLRNFGVGTPAEQRERVRWLLERVGLPPEAAARFPHEFSGGQRQRLGIARALATNPRLIVCDEPVSALDVSVQAQVINLLTDLQRDLGLAYLFVAHDLAVVRHIAQRVAVMYLGRIVEIGDRDTVFDAPRHPYTRVLLSAAPVPHPRAVSHRILLQGDPPSPAAPPPGCAFHTRCPQARPECRERQPELTPRDAGGAGEHRVACHLQ